MARMIAVDTNVLVAANRDIHPRHALARDAMETLVLGGRPWAVPWPCVHEMLGLLTHPRVFSPPSTQAEALDAVRSLAGLPGCRLLGETSRHLDLLADLCASPGVVGPKIHDARIAAICLGHEVDELWTADRDFSLFPALRTRNPFAVR